MMFDIAGTCTGGLCDSSMRAISIFHLQDVIMAEAGAYGIWHMAYGGKWANGDEVWEILYRTDGERSVGKGRAECHWHCQGCGRDGRHRGRRADVRLIGRAAGGV